MNGMLAEAMSVRKAARLALAACIALLPCIAAPPQVHAQSRAHSAPSVAPSLAIAVIPAVPAPPAVPVSPSMALPAAAPSVTPPAPAVWLRAQAGLVPSVIVRPPPPPPAPPPPVYLPTPPLPSTHQPPRTDLTLPCLTCGFKPPPAAPVPSGTEQTQEKRRAQRLAQIERLRSSAQQLIEQRKLEEALDTLGALLNLLEQEGSVAEQGRAQIREVRNRVALNWGVELLTAEKYADALTALDRADPSAAREELAAKAHFGRRDLEKALTRLNALEGFDAPLATRLRGGFYLELGALPLAVEQFELAADDPDIARYLGELEHDGLRRFKKSSHGAWAVYSATGSSKPKRTLSYWFYATSSGRIDAARPALFAVRPAPRKLTLGLILKNLIRFRWPDSDTAREYTLSVYADKRADLVAMWDREPTPEQLTVAAARGFKAMPQLKRADELLHRNHAREALPIALAEGRTKGWFFPEQPNYAALAKAVQAAVEMKDDQRAREITDDIARWHPMWAPLVLANAYQQAERTEDARAAYEQAIAAGSLRIEPYEKSAAFEWGAAKTQKDIGRAESYLRAQRAARRLESFNPVAGIWLRAQIASDLQANALTWELLQRLAGLANVPEAAFELQALLVALGQSKFEAVGEALPGSNGLQLRAYRTRQSPPDDAALLHHSVEVLVFTPDGHLVETFAVSSQGVPPGTARQFMLDRINAFGLQPLRIYGAQAPGWERVLKGVAAL